MAALTAPTASLDTHDTDGDFVVGLDYYRPGDHPVLPPAFEYLAL
jgi:hypothetical protein